MNSSLRRVATCAAAAVVGTLTAVVVAAAPAGANCNGYGNGVTITALNDAGIVSARERNVTGTCDRDGIYNGQLQDPLTDGFAARIRYIDGSYNAVVAYAGTTAWTDYRYYDQTGNTEADIKLYADPSVRPIWTLSNWGY